MKTFKVETYVSIKEGLELFQKLGIKVQTLDMIEEEDFLHNQVIEVPSKRLMAQCPATHKWVDFEKAYKAILNARATQIALDVDLELAQNVISNL